MSSTITTTSLPLSSLTNDNNDSSSSSSSPIPPPPALSVPVWSLATTSIMNGKENTNSTKNTTNMNIMTYCMPVSIGPPKLWALSIFKETLTREMFLDSRCGILQLLTKDQHALVSILGKQSGTDIDKAVACEQAGWKWRRTHDNDDTNNCQVLPSCSLYLEVQIMVESSSSSSSEPSMLDAHDHWVVLCQVTNTGEWDEENQCIKWKRYLDDDHNKPSSPIDGIGDNAMYSGWLRQEGYL